MRAERTGARAPAQGPGAGGAEPDRRGRAAGGRGRGRAPPAASPCPSPRGGCIAERRGFAPPWCSSDSCTNLENRVKRKGKAWQRHLPLLTVLGLNSVFFRVDFPTRAFGSELNRKKSLHSGGRPGSEFGASSETLAVVREPRQGIGWVRERLGGPFRLPSQQRGTKSFTPTPGFCLSRRPSRSLQRG